MIYTLLKKSANGKKFELEDKSGESEWYTVADNVLKFNKWTKEGAKVEANVQDGEITYLKNLDAKGKGSWGGKTGGAGAGGGFNPAGLRQTALNGAVQVTASLIAVKAVEEDAVLEKIKELFNEFLTIVEGKKVSSDDKKEDADDDDEEDKKPTKKKVEFNKGDAVTVDSDDFSGKATIVSVDEDEETLMVKDKKGKKYEVKFTETTLEDEE